MRRARQPESIPLLIEGCAGLACLSGVLQHGVGWRPPMSRPGAKIGYATSILRVMGLHPGQGARRYLWAEPDSDVAALLSAYRKPYLMSEIGDVINAWTVCPFGPHPGWCARCHGLGRWDGRDLWEVLKREPRQGLWEGVEDAVSIAGWVLLTGWTRGNGGLCVAPDTAPPGVRTAIRPGATRATIAARFKDAPGWPLVEILQDARLVQPPFPPGSVAYLDPTYHGTTEYRHNLPRELVLELAQRWRSAGARVYVSEAEPLPLPGWHHVEITDTRRGATRTFGATPEWLTCSERPAWTPAEQGYLFGAT